MIPRWGVSFDEAPSPVVRWTESVESFARLIRIFSSMLSGRSDLPVEVESVRLYTTRPVRPSTTPSLPESCSAKKISYEEEEAEREEMAPPPVEEMRWFAVGLRAEVRGS